MEVGMKKVIVLLFLIISLPALGMTSKYLQYKVSRPASNLISHRIRDFFSNYRADRAVAAHGKILRKLDSQKEFHAKAQKRLKRYDEWSKKATPKPISRIINYLKTNAQRDADDSLKQIEYLEKEVSKRSKKGLEAVKQSPKFAEFEQKYKNALPQKKP
jgi:hypothetical protein